MPNLDVSFVLDDPEFRDDTLVLRKQNSQTVSAHGRKVADSQADLSFSGVVVPADATEVYRSADGERIEGSIWVHTRTPIAVGDTVVWHDNDYLVARIDDWSSYGTGFVSALCA